MKKRLNQVLLAAYIRTTISARTLTAAARRKLREKDGSFFSEHALAIIITVVIAGIVLPLLIALFKDKIFPKLDNKVDDFFALS